MDEPNVKGYYDGQTVVPHPNFVFLKNIPAFNGDGEIDEFTGNKVKKTSGGLFVMEAWEDSPQDIAQKSQKIKERIESLTKSKRTPEVQQQLEKMEAERQILNRKAQKHEFLPYQLAFANRKLERDMGRKLQDSNILYCYNKAALYLTNFQLEKYKYIICLVEHVGFLWEPAWEKQQQVEAREKLQKDFANIFFP